MYKILDIIIKPLKENLVFFFMMYLLGLITTFTQVIELHLKIPKFNFFSWIIDLYLICCIFLLFPNRVRRVIRGLVCVVLYLLAITDAFLNKYFYARIGPEIINLIMDTNSKESHEFLDKYINISALWSGVGLILLLIIVHIIFICHFQAIYNSIKSNIKNKLLWKITIVFAVVISTSLCLTSRVKIVKLLMAPSIEEIDLYINNHSLNTPTINLLFGLKMRQLADNELGKVAEFQETISVDSCQFTSSHIILIIGESYIKSHSQLYGYNLPTTPKQVERTKASRNGELITFSDVISPSNLTSVVFKNSFSLHSIDDKTSWRLFALFPVLFRKAGYHVTFITNQFVKSPKQDNFNFSGGLFLNDNKLNKLQFDSRNTITHQYDEDLLLDYDSLKQYNTEKNLTIFHLAGQHIDFDKRTPYEHKFFQDNNYLNRKDLNKAERQTVADYDNATLYNDFIVDSIVKLFEDEDAIVIYMPDHGEECYDSIHRMGRMPQGNYSPEMIANEFEIPFWIWCSDSYIKKHPIILEQIKEARNRPFMTDDIPHLLLYLAGIQYKDYKESKNVISPRFDSKRKRLIDGIVDFDEMLKKK